MRLTVSASLSFLLLLFLLLPTEMAHATLYAPGETLDPSCAPTDVDCGVESVVGAGTTGQVPYYAADGNIVSATSTITILSGGNFGIGTSTPVARLDVLNKQSSGASELITNGTFTGGTTGWSLGDNVAYGTNNAVSTYAGSDPSLSTTFSTTAGHIYVITFTLSNENSPAYFYLQSDSLDFPGNNTALPEGTYKYVFSTDYTGTETLWFDDWNYNNGDTWTLDDVSVKELATDPSVSPALQITGASGEKVLSLGGNDQLLMNTGLGSKALSAITTGYENSAFGSYALQLNTTGHENTGIGNGALFDNTTGYYNTALGNNALNLNSSGHGNTAIGHLSLPLTSTGHDNTALGVQSLYGNTTGSGNVALGAFSLFNNSAADGLVAIGSHALYRNSDAVNNTAIGTYALSDNSVGTDNAALGYLALASSTSGNYNVAVGSYALRSSASSGNTAVGYAALASTTDGSGNTAIGEFALANNTFGGGNVAIGTNAMYSLVNANDAVAIGPFALYTATSSTYSVAIGYQALSAGGNVSSNIAVGWQALYSNNGGVDNIGIGSGTNYYNTTGERNVLLGDGAMFHNQSGSRNVAIGEGAFGGNGVSTSGNDNVIIGAWTGYTLTGGSGNTIIGANIASTSGGTYTNTVILGDGVGHQRILVNSSGNTGIASTSPWRTLSVQGNVAFNGLTGSIGAGSLCLSSNKEVVYNSGSDNCLSSLRSTKHDITDLTMSGEALISNLKPVSFIYNDDASSTVRYGFIAEDTAGVDAHLATYNASGNISGVDDRALISIMVKAVQEMLSTIKGFATSFTSQNITASQKLCIGSTCVTESQLQTLLNQSGQTPSSSTLTTSADQTATTTQDTNGNNDASTTPSIATSTDAGIVNPTADPIVPSTEETNSDSEASSSTPDLNSPATDSDPSADIASTTSGS